MKAPQSDSLITRTADCLRDAIAAGELRKELPGVRKLSRDLHVSVPTILRAVEILRDEGLLQPRTGRTTLIVPRGERESGATAPAASEVILLLFSPAWIAGCEHYQNVINALHGLGLDARIQECLQTGRTALRKELEALVLKEHPGCWVLMGPPLVAQQFFAERQLPCIINGIAFPGIALPDYEIDFEALYRHAISHLQNRGHWRICLLIAGHSVEINPRSVQVFEQFVARKVPAGEVWNAVHVYDDEMGRHPDLMASLFRQRETAPTALIVARQNRMISSMMWLLNHGYRIPEEVSLICRDAMDYGMGLSPTPAFYRRPAWVRRFVRTIKAVLEHRHLEVNKRVMIELVPGETVGPAPGR